MHTKTIEVLKRVATWLNSNRIGVFVVAMAIFWFTLFAVWFVFVYPDMSPITEAEKASAAVTSENWNNAQWAEFDERSTPKERCERTYRMLVIPHGDSKDYTVRPCTLGNMPFLCLVNSVNGATNSIQVFGLGAELATTVTMKDTKKAQLVIIE